MAWRRAIGRLFCLGLAAIALIAGTVLSTPLWLGPLIAWQASSRLARPVTIGHLSLHLGDPIITIADDVVIGNPGGFAQETEPFARISRLTVRIDVTASVRRQAIVIASAEVERPVLRVIATEDGRKNYSLPTASSSPIGAFNVLDGHARVSLADLQAECEVTFTTEHETGRASATRIIAEARGIYAGEPVVVQVAAGLPSDTQNPLQGWPVEIAVQNGPTQASVKGTLQEPFSLRGVIADFVIAGPDMALLRPLTDVPFPVTPPYELRGKLDLADGVYRITDAKGRLARSALEGTMTIETRPGQRPAIKAALQSRSVDLRDVVSLLSGGPGSPGTPGQTPQQQAQAARAERKTLASPRILPQTPLQLGKLGAVNLHLSFRAARIQGAAMPFDNLSFGMDLVDGEIALHQLNFGIGQGRLSGDFRLTPRTKEAVQARGNIHFERVDVGRLLWASGGYRGHGALNGTIDLQGTGRSVAEILAGADGTASLWMRDGELSSLLVDLAGLRLGSALLSSLAGSPTTNVECFLADLALRRGVLSTRTLLLETADAVTEGVGAVDLANERVDIRLRTQSRHLTVGVLPAPLLISGTLKGPRAAPDPAAAAGHGGLAGALAALPTVQLGVGDAQRCKILLSQLRKG
jgi:AsmA family protein